MNKNVPSHSRPYFLRRMLSLVLVFLLFVLPCFPTGAHAETQRRIVRVGYPISPGLNEIDENGIYSGYTYEYLQEIAQYTGWEYEFVKLSGTQNEVLTKMYSMLEKGELDLMGSTNYSEELDKIYDYPLSNYGSVSSTLEVLEENTSINNVNYQGMGEIRIAVLKNAKNGISALNSFCEINHINPSLVYCDSEQDMLAALKENRAEMLLLNDVAAIDGTRIIARFNPKPFYFATTQGNNKIIEELNNAMTMLNSSDPYFPLMLSRKYFSRNTSALHFTDDEIDYIKKSPPLKVGISENRLPLDGTDSQGKFIGISPDFMKMISEKTGLKFEIVSKKSATELFSSLESRDIDLAMGINYDYNSSQNHNFSLSRPYMSAQVIMAVKDGINPYDINGKRLALTRGSEYNGDFMGDVVWYDSILDCLQAVNDGNADYCYGNGYSVEYYCNMYQYKNLTLVPQSSQINQYCIGIVRPVDPLLLNILNKTIHSIPQGDIQAMIYKNSVPSKDGISLRDFIESHPIETSVILASIVILSLGILSYIIWIQRRARKKAQIENERYRILADMSGEYLFEYDFLADRLTMTEKTVKTFGGSAVRNGYYKSLMASDDKNLQWIRSIYDNIKNEKSSVVETQAHLQNGRDVWLRITVAAIIDSEGKASYLIGKITDIQSEKQERDDLALKAQTDGLTGLYNAAAFRSLTEEILANDMSESPGAFLIIDVDNFKSVNDQLGHYTGDQFLQNMSDILHNVFRKSDILGRIGGDEFAVFIRGAFSVEKIADRCRVLQSKADAHSSKYPIPITLSIGVSIANKNSNYTDLYKAADSVLYTVKENGKDSFLIAQPSSDF